MRPARHPRRFRRQVYLSISCLALASLLFAGPPAHALAPPTVGCARCIVVTPEGEVLWARAPRDRYPNASTTKMVTALLASRATDPSDVVTVSSSAGAIGGGGLDLAAGDTYTVDALMYALLLDSSNEAAQALAEHVGGSASRFVDQMNAYARSIGARRTHFANPHGLDAEGHYASAADLALIGAKLLEDPYLAEIVATADATIDTPRGRVALENRNLLLESYQGAIGIKTGRTLGAGNVLVAAARRNGKTVITVAMNSYDTFADSAEMLDFGFAELRRLSRRGTLVEAGEPIGELVFDSGAIEVTAGAGIEGLLPDDPASLELSFVASDDDLLPIESGDVVGTIQVSSDRGTAGEVPAIATGSIGDAEESPWWTAPIVGLVALLGEAVA